MKNNINSVNKISIDNVEELTTNIKEKVLLVSRFEDFNVKLLENLESTNSQFEEVINQLKAVIINKDHEIVNLKKKIVQFENKLEKNIYLQSETNENV